MVQVLIDHYENQSDEEAIAEMEAAPDANFTVMAISLELVPQVERLIGKRAG